MICKSLHSDCLYVTSHAHIQTALQIENVLFASVIYWYITCLGAYAGL